MWPVCLLEPGVAECVDGPRDVIRVHFLLYYTRGQVFIVSDSRGGFEDTPRTKR